METKGKQDNFGNATFVYILMQVSLLLVGGFASIMEMHYLLGLVIVLQMFLITYFLVKYKKYQTLQDRA